MLFTKKTQCELINIFNKSCSVCSVDYEFESYVQIFLCLIVLNEE
jgi:hypothetical protein